MTLPNVTGRPVSILGAGVLGRRIAAVWIAGGYDVHVRDPSTEQREAAKQFVKEHLSEFSTPQQSKAGNLKVFEDLKEAVEEAWLVVECETNYKAHLEHEDVN